MCRCDTFNANLFYRHQSENCTAFTSPLHHTKYDLKITITVIPYHQFTFAFIFNRINGVTEFNITTFPIISIHRSILRKS